MNWDLLRDGIILSSCMLVATYIRTRIVFLRTYYVPCALIAGVIALPIYEFLHLPREMLGAMVYHFLNISFISMSLRSTHASASLGNMVRNSVAIFFQYAVQILLGLLVTVLFVYTVMPGLSLGFGSLLPLGFALGAGTAYSISRTWEGFPDAAVLSLFIASVGYIIACFVGIILIKQARRKNRISAVVPPMQAKDVSIISTAALEKPASKPHTEFAQGNSWNNNSVIDKFTIHISVILLVYGLTWGLLSTIEMFLQTMGEAGISLARSLWGVAFIFASLIAHGSRAFLKRYNRDAVLDNSVLTRINGTAIDYMLCASIAAIVFRLLAIYWLPLLVIIVLGFVLTLVSTQWFCSCVYRDHIFARTLIIFGVSTGTLSAALGLLRVIDPDFMLPVANDYMHSMKLNFFLAIPLILVINLPYRSSITGKPILLYITLAVATLYAVICLSVLYLLRRKRKPVV